MSLGATFYKEINLLIDTFTASEVLACRKLRVVISLGVKKVNALFKAFERDHRMNSCTWDFM